MTFQELTWLNPEKCPFSELYGRLKSWLANVFPSVPWNPPAGSAMSRAGLRPGVPEARGPGPAGR